MKFKKGDKVRVKRFEKRPNTWNEEGKMDHLMGKVVEVNGVLFSGTGLIIYDEIHKKTWVVDSDQVEPVNEKIVIYREDNKVIAKNLATGEVAEARCNPSDKFCFETGARLAFDRLTGKETEKKPLNTKIVFTKGDIVFQTGHIYEIKDGILRHPFDGEKLPRAKVYGGAFYSIEDVKDYFTKKGDRKLHKCGWSNETLEFIEVLND